MPVGSVYTRQLPLLNMRVIHRYQDLGAAAIQSTLGRLPLLPDIFRNIPPKMRSVPTALLRNHDINVATHHPIQTQLFPYLVSKTNPPFFVPNLLLLD